MKSLGFLIYWIRFRGMLSQRPSKDQVEQQRWTDARSLVLLVTRNTTGSNTNHYKTQVITSSLCGKRFLKHHQKIEFTSTKESAKNLPLRTNLQIELKLSLQNDQHLHEKMIFENRKISETQRYLNLITKSSTIHSDIEKVIEKKQKLANTNAQKVELLNIYIQSVFTRNANVGKTERQDNVLLNSGPDKIGNALLKPLKVTTKITSLTAQLDCN